MMIGKTLLAQCPIDEILVETEMKPHSYKFNKLGSPHDFKSCLKREKPMLFSGKI